MSIQSLFAEGLSVLKIPRKRAGRRNRRARARLGLEALEDRSLLTTLPAGFSATLITTGVNLNAPTAMEFSPTGQLWALEQTGAVRVINLGTGGASLAGTLTVNSVGERGLLGIAFPASYDGSVTAPDFVYLYYTATTPNIHNRLSRFTVVNAGGPTPTIDTGSELIILEVAPEPDGDDSSNHNGGAIHFDQDGLLYIAIGDHNNDNSTGANHVSQRLTSQQGKLLRIDVNDDDFPADPNRNYAIPDGNPFIDANAATFDEIWTLGLRNPYTFAVQPGTGRIFINDVGEGSWEEINDGIAGSNYGWASEGTPGGVAEGFENSAPGYATVGTYRNPIMAYDSNNGPCAITGGVFYPEHSQFGSTFANKYFFSDYCGNFIRVFDPATPGSTTTPNTSTGFASGVDTGSPVDLKVDANGSLYYLAGANSPNGEIYRIDIVGQAPTVTGVFARGSTWSTNFRNHLASQGVGDAALGFSLPLPNSQVNAMPQPNNLPWVNVNQISIVFSENVSVPEDSLTLIGSGSLPDAPASTGFSYNGGTFTATWTFPTLTRNKYLIHLESSLVTDLAGYDLDGEWVLTNTSLPSGDGFASGDFDFRFNVLPADVNGTGTVATAEANGIRSHLNQSTAGPPYTFREDLDGSGTVSTQDANTARLRLNTTTSGLANPTVPTQQLLSLAGDAAEDSKSAASTLGADWFVTSSGVQTAIVERPTLSIVGRITYQPRKLNVAGIEAIFESLGQVSAVSQDRKMERMRFDPEREIPTEFTPGIRVTDELLEQLGHVKITRIFPRPG